MGEKQRIGIHNKKRNYLLSWSDKDHAHFLVQSIPIYIPTRLIQTIKVSLQKKNSDFILKWRRNFGEVNFGQRDFM